MSVVQVAMVGITGVFTALLIKNTKAEISLIIAIITACILMYYCLLRISDVISILDFVRCEANVQDEYYYLLLKILGISYVCEFSADLCKDSGYSLVAEQIQLFGKISIFSISINVFVNLLELIWGMV